MKKVLLVFVTVLFLVPQAFAQNTGKGVGVIIGEPTGISLKLWQSSSIAFDGGLAWSIGPNSRFHFHGDYLIHNKEVLNSPNAIFYFGPGLRLRLGDEDRIGVRGVAGVDIYFKQAPIDFFIEVAPILDLIPGTYLSFNAGFGFRYFLN